MHTGSIIDFYDDPEGSVLKERVDETDLPPFIKTAHYYDDTERDRLPDDVFALVMVDRGEKLRKFACADKGNTALSVIYFMENHNKLPLEAQKTAAANLVNACRWHELQAPMGLWKLAGFGGLITGAMHIPDVKARIGKGVARHKSMMGKLGDLTGSNIMPLQSSPDMSKEAQDDWYDRNAQLQQSISESKPLSGALGGVGGALAGGRIAKVMGKSTRAGGVLGALGGAGIGLASAALAKKHRKAISKLGSVLAPYVDVTGKQPPPRFEKRAHQRYCLVKEGQGRFPIDDYGQVLEANRWFEEHGHSLHPEDRREYCVKLAERADEIGIAVTDKIRKYGGQGYAPDGEIKVAVQTRMQFWAEDSSERDMLKGLMNKYAHVPPEVFCEALHQFDEVTGMNHLWDDGIYDPWYSTYGFEKEATWSWSHGNDRVTDGQLKKGARENFQAIKEHFGEEMASELLSKPQQIFDSLPLDSKRIIARIVTDPL